LATPAGIENWIRAGSAISANTSTPADWYAGSYKLKVAADIANSASGIGFDASDLMPAKVGAGTFWTKMDDWVNNNGTNTDATLKAIDDSWPAQ
ncbi:MAG: carbohydrate ABC transporter substrate-binding protein, partial [Candidatus Limnocylindrales bacterium]